MRIGVGIRALTADEGVALGCAAVLFTYTQASDDSDGMTAEETANRDERREWMKDQVWRLMRFTGISPNELRTLGLSFIGPLLEDSVLEMLTAIGEMTRDAKAQTDAEKTTESEEPETDREPTPDDGTRTETVNLP